MSDASKSRSDDDDQPERPARVRRHIKPLGPRVLVRIDTDGDRQVTVEGETVNRKLALMSVGFFELNESGNTNDLIRSWQ